MSVGDMVGAYVRYRGRIYSLSIARPSRAVIRFTTNVKHLTIRREAGEKIIQAVAGDITQLILLMTDVH